MTELEQALTTAFNTDADDKQQDTINQAYLVILRSDFYLPVHKTEQPQTSHTNTANSASENDTTETATVDFTPLSLQHDGKYFMPVFASETKLRDWADDQIDHMEVVKLSGKELFAGTNDNVYLCLNLGDQNYYKEFSPDEIKHLQRVIAKTAQILQQQQTLANSDHVNPSSKNH